ncbi:hypothetical protein ACNRDG_06480 [Ralstonia pseudosolanacearum]|uniref:hypothetical protein n=1 Tax=Ralstonia pseudosolanacearum TaxID=1310165 RepID=UPI003AAAAE5A
MTSTSNPPIALTLSLIVLFAVLFVLGVYWLLFRKGHPLQPSPTRPGAAAGYPSAQVFNHECEAMAPYPEHATRAMQQARLANQARHAASSFHDMREPTSTGTQHPTADPHDDWEYWEETPRATPPSCGTSDHAAKDGHPTQDLHDAWKSFQEALEPEPPSASSAPPSPASAPAPQVRCPRCLSSRIDTRNLARKAGTTIGSVAGATGGIAAALAGAETGAVVGSIAGPLGTVFGGLAGAVIAGLVGSAAGCAAGSAVGGAIDDNILDNRLCLACGHAFSAPQD